MRSKTRRKDVRSWSISIHHRRVLSNDTAQNKFRFIEQDLCAPAWAAVSAIETLRGAKPAAPQSRYLWHSACARSLPTKYAGLLLSAVRTRYRNLVERVAGNRPGRYPNFLLALHAFNEMLEDAQAVAEDLFHPKQPGGRQRRRRHVPDRRIVRRCQSPHQRIALHTVTTALR